MKHARSDYNRRIVDLDNKIPEDEPVFLLRSSDKLAPRLLLQWATELRLSGGDPLMATNVESHAQEMIRWQKTHGSKTPDVYYESSERIELKSQLTELLNRIRKTGKLESFSSLNNLTKQFYDTDAEVIYILSKSDLKINRVGKLINDELQIEDFYITDFDQYLKSKLVIFISSDSSCVILNSKIE